MTLDLVSISKVHAGRNHHLALPGLKTHRLPTTHKDWFKQVLSSVSELIRSYLSLDTNKEKKIINIKQDWILKNMGLRHDWVSLLLDIGLEFNISVGTEEIET